MDNSCLFAAFAFLCEGLTTEVDRVATRRLREVCARVALEDPDPTTRELVLGQNISEYAQWIRDDNHWGGEHEVLALARHYCVEVAIASCEGLRMLVYGADDNPEARGRIYLLYTGQHYDAFIGVAANGAESRVLPRGTDARLEGVALEAAKAFNEEAARVAKQRKVKKIQCGGCKALLDDAEAFQAHCTEVEHADDFAYDCAEVEVVLEGDAALPAGHLDLTDTQNVHCFNNANASELFSTMYAARMEVDGEIFDSLEHFWRAAAFAGSAPDIAKHIADAPTAEEARSRALAADLDKQRPLWPEERERALLKGLKAKLLASEGATAPMLRQALQHTGSKTIVNVDPDPWMGMQASGGISSGRNHLGKALMELREDLRTGALRHGSESLVLEGESPILEAMSSWFCCGAI